MQRYYETVIDTLTGAAVANAEVWTFHSDDSSLATVYLDPAGTDPAPNPLITDTNGYYEFYAADDLYTLEYRAAGATLRTITDVAIFDLPDLRADVDAVLAQLATVTAFGWSLIDDANAAAARGTLGLGTMAVAAASDYYTAVQVDAALAAAGAITEATDSQVWTGTATTAMISPRRLFTSAAAVALVDGATITINGNTGINFSVTLGGNRTLANPTNMKSGQSGVIAITQDGTGSRTLTYGANWLFPGGQASGGVLSTAAGKVDAISYFVLPSGGILATVTKGFAA